MLTESQYEELLRYRGDGIQFSGHKDETTEYLIGKRYIIGYHPISSDGSVCGETVTWVITEPGKRALEEFEEYARKMSYERAEKKSDRRFQVLNTLLSAVVGSLLTLLVEHFSKILELLRKLFQ